MTIALDSRTANAILDDIEMVHTVRHMFCCDRVGRSWASKHVHLRARHICLPPNRPYAQSKRQIRAPV